MELAYNASFRGHEATRLECIMKITIWNEYVHEKTNEVVRSHYPEGIHQTIAQALRSHLPDVEIGTATLEEPDHGLTQSRLDDTDVLFWWGHCAHDQVRDDIVDRVQKRVLAGMGLIVLHSGHASKIFQRLMGTSCMLRWRDVGELERLWFIAPHHPILEGLDGEFFEIPTAEMYGEYFDIPQPDEVLMISWFQGGEVFRSGCTFTRGKGKIFYFRPGHETFPIYHHASVQQILANAAKWAKPTGRPTSAMVARLKSR